MRGFWLALLLVTVVVVLPMPSLAKDYVVNNSLDAGTDGACTTDTGGCTLRDAVRQANASPEADIITINDFPGQANDSSLSLVNSSGDEDAALTGDLDITDGTYSITIQGSSAKDIIIDANDIDRVFEVKVFAQLILNNITITNGTAQDGGCIFINGVGSAQLNNVAITNCHATQYGGAIFAAGSNTVSLQISKSTISSNIADSDGAGIAFFPITTSGSTFTLTNSTVANNNAKQSAGAIYNVGIATIVASTIASNGADSDNNSSGNGGGIMNYGNVTLSGTILANNTDAGGAVNNDNCFNSGGSISATYTLDSGTSCAFSGGNNLSSANPLLGSLMNNGGGTATMALSYGSPAINTSSSSVGTTDQRDTARPQGSGYDIGAYEYKDSDSDGYVSENDCGDTDATVHTTRTFYQDADADGLGNPTVSTSVCASTLSGYVTNNSDTNDQDADNDGISMSSDCDDHNATITASPQTYYEDADSDGLGNANSSIVSCTQPGGYVTNNSDTDDASVTTTINSSSSGSSATPTDTDKDGISSDQDCDDNNSSITYTKTYYQDVDTDTIGGSTTTTICSNTIPLGYVTTTGDCNDSDATVTTSQVYYQDADSDGQGNASVSTSTCSSTAPTGYVTNDTDPNDTVDSAHIELPNDGISNDGDADIDEANTLIENGIYPTYGSTDPTDSAAYTASISSIKGKKNGKIKVVFADGVKYSYAIFDVDTNTKTKVKPYHNSGYLVVLNPFGKKIALVNPYTGAVVNTLSIQTSTKYSNNSLKQANLRTDQDTAYEMVVTSVQNTAVQLSIVKVKIKKLKLSLKDTLMVTLKNVDVSETQLASTTITTRTTDDATVKQYVVDSNYMFNE